MKREDKELLLKDLCARLLYGVKCELSGDGAKLVDVLQLGGLGQFMLGRIEVKPYLRSMASMTEEEEKMYTILRAHALPFTIVSWLDEHMFDHRTDMSGEHLIELGLALEAPKGIYNETV